MRPKPRNNGCGVTHIISESEVRFEWLRPLRRNR